MTKEIVAAAKSKTVLALLALPVVGLASAAVAATGIALYRRRKSRRNGELTEREMQEKASRLENAWR